MLFLVNCSLLVVVVPGSFQLQIIQRFVVGVVVSKHQSVGSGGYSFITIANVPGMGGWCCS